MKQSLKDFFEGVSIKNTLFTIIWTIGILGWIYFAVSFSETRAEANNTWNMVQQIREQKVENKTKDVGQAVGGEFSLSSTANQDTPKAERVEDKISTLPAGSIEDILPKIQMLESSGGKNDSCKQKGLVNGYGYMQSTYHWKCFETKAEVEKEVAAWFTKNLQNKTLEESLCYYNQGIVTSDCEYAKHYLALK